jgi:mannose-6-phosphate isomerase-like protein (cupin superfamily)
VVVEVLQRPIGSRRPEKLPRETIMLTASTGLVVLVLALASTTTATQGPEGSAGALASGTATYVPSAEIRAAVEAPETGPTLDSVLRVVAIGGAIEGEYNVGVSVVRRAKVDGRTPPDALSHAAITEVYHVLEGSGVLVTGGSLEGETALPADGRVVRELVGPSSRGSAIAGGTKRRVGPGDIVIVPPNTPHGFLEISSERIVYLLVRVDPQRLLAERAGPP